MTPLLIHVAISLLAWRGGSAEETPAAAAASNRPAAAASQPKLAPPEGEALERASKLAEEIFKDEYEKADSAVAFRKLATKTVEKAGEINDDPAARFVFLRSARNFAAKAGDATLAFSIVDRLNQAFEIDPWEMKIAVLEQIAKQARDTAGHADVARRAIALMRAAVAQDAFAGAEEAAKLAKTEAAKAKSKELAAEAQLGSRQIEQAAKAFKRIAAAREALKENPDDPEANLILGAYTCFTKGVWAEGLPFLVKGDDLTLKGVAERELGVEGAGEDALLLADRWWDLAQQREGKEKTAILLHAGQWYRKVLANLTSDVVRLKVKGRLAQLEKLDQQSQAAGGASPANAITNSIGMKLVLIPAGEFAMGHSADHAAREIQDAKNRGYFTEALVAEVGCSTPQHKVRITRPFYLGVYEVTQAEYEQVMGFNPSAFSSWEGKSGAGTASLSEGERTEIKNGSEKVAGKDTSRYPVDRVSWEDVSKFCQKLSAMPKERTAGRVYRIPTEAEWEYACRAGTSTYWSCGDDVDALSEYGWFGNTSEGSPRPVGQKKPNAWGLYDMHGNVAEWCLDWHDGKFYRQSPLNDPMGPPTGTARIIRGSAWLHDPANCSSCGHRQPSGPTGRSCILGFRVVAVVGR